jgi:hypothetical protein
VVEVTKQLQMSRLIESDESEFSALGVKDRRPNSPPGKKEQIWK